MTMVETLAAAILDQMRCQEAPCSFVRGCTCANEAARAALTALLTPSPEMVAAGRDFPTVPLSLGNGQTVQVPGFSATVDNVFKAMIQSALSEKTG